MAELIDIYTEDGQKMGTISKKEYYSGDIKDVPWIKCCTCFVIDDKEQKVLFEKRGKRFLDPGKLDLCSGHVQSGEVPTQSMIRELDEELSIPEDNARNIRYLGELKIDYTKLTDETDKKQLKCFVSVYALKMREIAGIQIDNNEAVSMGWLSLEDAIGFISNNMTRLPYNEQLEQEYNRIFANLKCYIYPELNKNMSTEKDK